MANLIEIAPGVQLLRGVPDYLVNVYLIGDVLLDAGTRSAAPGILRQLRGQTVRAHALTHAHPDHQGGSHAICQALNIPLWSSEAEVAAVESGSMANQIPQNPVTAVITLSFTGPGHPVARALREGDEVAGFTVLAAPGHSPGQVAYWRERDRVLILGDVLGNVNMVTLATRIGEPPDMFTYNIAQNRASARRLAALRPRIVCFGHGHPLMDGERMVAFVDQIPADTA